MARRRQTGRNPDPDSARYWHFTGPARLNKSLHTIEGLFSGIASDGVVTPDEMEAVKDWVRDHADVANRHPFNELMPFLEDVLRDGVVDLEELEDVQWLCRRVQADTPHYNAVTSDIQRLQGMLGGIASDGIITKNELLALEDWMNDHEHLKTCWPFDEISSLITGVLRDGRIDKREHVMLLEYFAQFVDIGGAHVVDLDVDEIGTSLTGLCAVCPEIVFADHRFCVTGKSERALRTEFAATVEQRGGWFSNSLTKKTHYLIVGANGNPAWAYACYGRKVEQAVRYRREGSQVLIVHENDFWDAVEDDPTG